LRFTDAERRQLAVLGKKLGRKALAEVATIATPDTILRWYRQLVAKKYDGSALRGPGRPRTAAEIHVRAAADRENKGEQTYEL
jgi:putative transposase